MIMKVFVGKLPIKDLLDIFSLTRSYWDKYRQKPLKMPERDEPWRVRIVEVFNKNLKSFGYRLVTEELRAEDHPVNHKRISRIMTNNGICAQYVKKEQKKADKKRGQTAVNVYPDLVKRQFSTITTALTVLYTDITEEVINGEKVYQSTIMDAASRLSLNATFSARKDLALVLENLKNVVEMIRNVSPTAEIRVHSDHGSQYTSGAWKQACEAAGLLISMGENYTSADNAVMEALHSRIKKSTIHNRDYQTKEEYIADVLHFLKIHNRRKLRNVGDELELLEGLRLI